VIKSPQHLDTPTLLHDTMTVLALQSSSPFHRRSSSLSVCHRGFLVGLLLFAPSFFHRFAESDALLTLTLQLPTSQRPEGCASSVPCPDSVDTDPCGRHACVCDALSCFCLIIATCTSLCCTFLQIQSIALEGEALALAISSSGTFIVTGGMSQVRRRRDVQEEGARRGGEGGIGGRSSDGMQQGK